ncbi:MAG: MFS transporter [Planctomycetia bacterium]|nr:MFS transporter [Planctomycetia bacterium]
MSENKVMFVYPRLMIAYLFQFAIWGSWSYALSAYPGIDGNVWIFKGVGGLFSAFALGALFSPLIGPIADSKFAAQKVLAFLHLICGMALLSCGVICQKAGTGSVPYFPILAMMFLAGLTYMPSIPLINAVVFKNIPNKDRSPLVFIFGTLGWILINLLVGKMQGGNVQDPIFFFLGGFCALFLAFYSMTLPNTPPQGKAGGDLFGLKALGLFKRADFTLFVLCAFCVGIFGSNFYFPMLGQYLNEACGVKDAATFGTLNQVSEIVFMAALAFAVALIGLKWVLVCGLAAWTIRYGLFSTCDKELAIVGILLHGLAYAFLYTAAYMFGDRVAPANLKASVQSLLAFLLLGVGQVLSGIVLEELKDRYPLEAAASVPAVEKADEDAVSFFSFSNNLYAQEEPLTLPATEEAARPPGAAEDAARAPAPVHDAAPAPAGA